MAKSDKVQCGLVVDVAEETTERVKQILHDIPGGAQNAIYSALARAGESGRTVAARAAAKEYTITQSVFNANIRAIERVKRMDGDTISIKFGYCGYVIPLISFDTRVTANGYVATRVKRSSTREILDNAFMTNVGTHTGIFERETSDRKPIKELFGPAPTQMMYSNEEVMDSVEERASEMYEQRIEHEIYRILNGYGGGKV
jgi:hypothetical protein